MPHTTLSGGFLALCRLIVLLPSPAAGVEPAPGANGKIPAWFKRRSQLRVDRIEAGWRSWTNEKSLWHRVCLHFAFVEEPYPAPYGAPVHSLAASAPGDPERTNDNLEPPRGRPRE